MAKHGPETGKHILQAALKRFANAGYAATSVQQIVDDAQVSKPALYYHFQDKAGLFKALVHEAQTPVTRSPRRRRQKPQSARAVITS